MSKKKNLPLEDPPIATSSDDEEDSGSETESGSDSEMEEEESSKPVAVTTSAKPKNKEVRASSAAAAASAPPPVVLKSALKRPATPVKSAVSAAADSDSDSEMEEEPSKPVAVATSNKPPVKPADSDSGSETESGSDSEMEEEEESSKPVAVTTSVKPRHKEVRASSAASDPPPALKSALKRPAAASKGTSTPPVKPAVSAAADSDSGSGSDSDMEEEPSKPIAVTTSTKPKNKEAPGSSAAASTPPPVVLKSALKRPATASAGTSTATKRAKTGEESDSKKASSQRVWSEEDEIKLLQGLIDFNADTGKSPYDNMNGYFDSVKKSFSFDPSKVQFTEKVRGLKKKYLSKGPFTKDHDKESMGLAKLIWGPHGFGCVSTVVKSSNGKSNKGEKNKVEEAEKDVLVRVGADQEPRTEEKSDWFESSYVVKSIATHGLDEDYVKQKWRSAPVEDKKRLEEMYKLLRAKEVEYVLFKTEFLNEVVPMIFISS